jgi:flagellar hook-associated protein 3 FlgL
MRITTKMFYDRFLSDMQKNMETVFKASEQISTQKKINRPSDDPTAMSRIIGYTTHISAIGEYKRAIDSAKGSLEAADSSLSGLNDILTRAKELALSGATGTTDANSRLMIAKEIGVLFESAVGIANTKVGDRYIFSGFKSNIAPIDVNTGEFVADTNIFEISISQSIEIGLNIPASELFSFKRVNSTDPPNAVLPPYNWNNNGTITIPDADPISAIYTSSGSFTNPSSDVFTVNGGTLTVTVGENDTTPVNITIAPNATLNDVRNTINTANAGVKAEVVNFGTSASPDYRIVVASNPIGSSDKIKITVSTSDGAGTGLNRLAYDPLGITNMTLGTNITNYNYVTNLTSNDDIVINNSNNQIYIKEGAVNGTAVITQGTYTPTQLGTAIKSALESATASANTYTVSYSSATKKFTIASDAGNADALDLLWSSTNTKAAQLLGFDTVDTTGIGAGGSDISDFSVLNSNYYSFNNNYLNDNNVLRALHFLKVSLEMNDVGRIQKALDYINKVAEKVYQQQAEVGARLNKLDQEFRFQDNREYDIQTYLSNDQDADIPKLTAELAQSQAALESLRVASSNFLRTSLFDFIK